MGTKIVIATADAMDKLLGGDDETSLELRQAAAAEFAKRHLKALANSPQFSSAVAQVREAVSQEVRKAIPIKFVNGAYSIKSAEVLEAIENEVDKQLLAHVKKAVADKLSNPGFLDELNEMIRSEINNVMGGFAAEVRRALFKKLEKALNEPLTLTQE